MSTVPTVEMEDRVGHIADEFLSRLQRGEEPTVNEYVAAHPDLTVLLRDVLPLVKASHGPRSQSPVMERLGEFRLVREIGRGGMGVVYEAIQEPLGRRVALKVLPAAVQIHSGYLERFRREAQAAARLHHTHIVPVFGMGSAGGIHYIAMQFIEGEGLDKAHALQRVGVHDVARIGLQSAEALAHAHAHGVLHRDIKPSNLLLDRDGNTWVTDFGLAKLDDGDELTSSGDFLGTLRYAAPERLHGAADERSDVYSLGATLYELLGGRAAFAATARDELMRQIEQEEPARLSRVVSGIPRDLETIVLKSMAKEAERRYASAGEMADDVRRFLDGRPVAARRASLIEQVWRWCRRRPAVASLLAVTTTALVALLVVSLVGNARLSNALTRVGEERDRAEDNATAAQQAREAALTNLRRARQAVDRMLAQVGTLKLQGVPLVEQVRKQLLEDALKYSDEFLKENPTDPELRYELAVNYLRVGLLRSLLGDPAKALEANQKGVEILDSLRTEFPNAAHYESELAKHYHNLGSQLRAAGRLKDGEAAIRQALNLQERLVAAFPDNREYQLDLAKHHNGLGNNFHNQSLLPKAIDEFRAAIAIAERSLATDSQDFRMRYERAYATCALGTALGAYGRLGQAESELRKAVRIYEELSIEDPRAPNCRRELAQAHTTLSQVLLNTNRTDAAEVSLKRAVSVSEQLVAEFPSTMLYWIQLRNSLNALGLIHLNPGRHSEAESIYRRALTVAEKLANDAPTVPENRLMLANIHTNLGLVFENSDRVAEADAAGRVALEIKEKLAADFPASQRYQSMLAASLNNRAGLLLKRGELAEARQLATRAVAVQQGALKVEPNNPQYREFLFNQLSTLASVHLKNEDYSEAAAAMTQAAAVRPNKSDDAFIAGYFLAECGIAVAKNERLSAADQAAQSKSFGDQAVTMLHVAVRRGYRDVKQLKSAAVFRPLQERADFQQLLRDIAAAPTVKP